MKRKTPRERLMGFVQQAPSGCWTWTAHLDKHGYGRFSLNARITLAHRSAYELFVAPIPDGMELDHACHSADLACPGGVACPHRSCVNPDHLEPVTPLENQARGNSPTGVNARKTHCIHGHEFNPENTYRWHGRRICRSCNKAAKARAARKRAAVTA